MRIINDNISFQSQIKFINEKSFKDKIKTLNPKRHEIGYPWTCEVMKKGKNLYTKNIMDCIAGGIIDGKDVLMFHLGIYNRAKAKIKHQKGFKIADVKRRILENIDLNNENLHGLILGGFQLQENSKYNVNKLNQIVSVFEENKIPYTIFGARKDVHYFGKFSLLYENKNDTWFITNNLTDLEYGIPPIKHISIDGNQVEYDVYTKNLNSCPMYTKTRKKSNVLEFLKNQFRMVKLSKYDNIGN